MSTRSFYRRILHSWQSFRFEILSFVLAVLGVWMAWKLSHKQPVKDWVVYVIVLWAIALVLHFLRIIYLIRKSKRRQ